MNFNDDMIQRFDLPRDVFELIHDLAYDHEGRDRAHYRTVAQIILKQAPPKIENRRFVEVTRSAFVELKTALHMFDNWVDADVHRPNCVLYAGYAQPELRRHMTELVFVPTKEKSMPITKEHLENWFTYHSPSREQNEAYVMLREAGLKLATAINDLCPPSADATAAIRKVREAVMTANAAIACGGQ